MIDGELAFPDEEPPANWHELRLGTAEGLAVTVRRESNRVVFVVWGNADAKLAAVRSILPINRTRQPTTERSSTCPLLSAAICQTIQLADPPGRRAA